MKTVPTVSVVMPAYRSASTLLAAASSVLRQGYEPLKLVVSVYPDDAETIAAAEALHDERVLIVHRPGHGIANGRNAALREVDSDLYMFLDSDDSYDEGIVSRYIDDHRSHPAPALRYGDWTAVSPRDGSRHRRHVYSPQRRVYAQLLLDNFIATPTVMVNREILDDVGWFEERYPHAEDWHLWLRIARRYPLRHVAANTAFYTRTKLQRIYPRSFFQTEFEIVRRQEVPAPLVRRRTGARTRPLRRVLGRHARTTEKFEHVVRRSAARSRVHARAGSSPDGPQPTVQAAMSRIAVTGVWHQGAVLSAGLAELGHDIVALADREAAERLSRAEPLVYEPGLAEAIRRSMEAGRLRYTSDPADALGGAEFAYISTDTPVDERDVPQLQEVFALAGNVREHAAKDAVLVVTAQVPLGTTERLATEAGRPAAYVPEFLELGVAMRSFREADRIVVGADDAAVGDRVEAIYAGLSRPVIRTSIRSAELAKHAANAFLAMSISFINELGDLAEQLGADIWTVAAVLRADRRIGAQAYLSPGLGFSGATLGRDLRVLERLAADLGAGAPLVEAVLHVNEGRAERVVERLERDLDGLQGRRIAIFGLTYKPGTNTLRSAISLTIARLLLDRGATLAAFDPLADLTEVSGAPQLDLSRDPIAAAVDADAVLHLTGWKGLQDLDLASLRAAMGGELFLDTRGDFDAARMRAAGFRYGRFPEGDL